MNIKFRLLCTLLFLQQFAWAQVPTITDFSPKKGLIGTAVTITGTNFSTTASNNIVKFNGIKATVSAATNTSLTVVVPIGVAHSQIEVKVGTMSTRSKLAFSVTSPCTNSTFTATTALHVGGDWNPRSLVTGDFNNDGYADFATSNPNADNITVFLATGANTYSAAGVLYTTGDNPQAIAIGDFNGDGNQDLVTANWNSNNVGVLRGNGNGTFQVVKFYNAQNQPRGVATGDVNRDGKTDIVVACNDNDWISVLTNDGSGGFPLDKNNPLRADYKCDVDPMHVSLGDLNNDGILDIVVACWYNEE